MSRPWRERLKVTGVTMIPAAALVAVGAARLSPSSHAMSVAGDSLRTERRAVAAPSTAHLEELSEAFATIAGKIKPSVVFITAKHQTRSVGLDGEALPPEVVPF